MIFLIPLLVQFLLIIIFNLPEKDTSRNGSYYGHLIGYLLDGFVKLILFLMLSALTWIGFSVYLVFFK